MSYAECCQPYHLGALPPTALALMRSRYTAYVLGLVDYIRLTETKSSSREELIAACKSMQLQGLTILGSSEDSVHFEVKSGKSNWQELSHFLQREGRWLYISPSS
ncbi:MAG: YchJ family metal-binding protein [Chlamydiota bacterium]